MPRLAKVAKKTAENHSCVHVKARERFVEDEDLGVVEQRCYKENFLAHPFGITGQRAVTVLPETDEPEKLVHLGFEDAPGEAAKTPHELQMFASAEVRIQVRLFGHVADAALKGFAGFGICVNVVAIKRDFPGRGLKQTNDHLDRGALSGAVGTEIAERFTAMNHEAGMVNNWDAGVTFREVADFEHDTLDTIRQARVPEGCYT